MKTLILTLSLVLIFSNHAAAADRDPAYTVDHPDTTSAQEAEVKNATTGEVAPALPAGRLENSAADGKQEKKAELPSPVAVKFSGFAWVEMEDSRNFGYNGASGLTNFDSSVLDPHQSFSTFFTNLQLDFTKDKTTLTTIFEVGEVFNGEEKSGGAQGGRASVMEVRDAYITHELNSHWDLKAGLLPLSSDPNSFIVADHFTAGTLNYRDSNWVASVWTAKAFDNKPGVTAAAANYKAMDQYTGLNYQIQVNSDAKVSAYGVLRKNSEALYDVASAATVNGRSQYTWYGATYDQNFGDVYGFQVTGIFNDGKFTGDSEATSDRYQAHLADLKLKAGWKERGLDILLEGLATSGASGAMDPTGKSAVIGKRGSFASPDPGASYLFTLATSDGADDAPGAPKESIIGNLSQAEGLQILLVKISQSFGDKWSGFVRAGALHAASANLATGSRHMGDEVDVNLAYQLSADTVLQMDYGYLKPGAFYEKRDDAHLLTTRFKFTF